MSKARASVLTAVKAYDLLTINGDIIPEASALEATQRTIRFGLFATTATIMPFS